LDNVNIWVNPMVNLFKPSMKIIFVVICVGDYVVIGAKIPRETKKLMDELGIKPGPLIRRAVNEEIRRRLLSRLEEEARELSSELPYISDEEIAELIREDRGR